MTRFSLYLHYCTTGGRFNIKTMLLRYENSGFPRFTRNFWDENSAAKRPRNWGGPHIMGARKMAEYCTRLITSGRTFQKPVHNINKYKYKFALTLRKAIAGLRIDQMIQDSVIG